MAKKAFYYSVFQFFKIKNHLFASSARYIWRNLNTFFYFTQYQYITKYVEENQSEPFPQPGSQNEDNVEKSCDAQVVWVKICFMVQATGVGFCHSMIWRALTVTEL